MAAVVPTIYSPRTDPARLSLAGRALALAVSLACLALLVTAAGLAPSPTGMGTHTALGLRACKFAADTGLPCISCGMTTSFAWFARGNLLASFYVQPMGAVLAAVAVAVFWTGLYETLTGRPVHRLALFVPPRYYVLPVLGWAIAAWAWKIFIHTHNIDGWRVG